MHVRNGDAVHLIDSTCPWRGTPLAPISPADESPGRRHMTRRSLAIVLTVVLTLGCSATAVLSQGTKVAMLLPGSVNDQSWNAAGYAGLVKLKDTGMEIA